MDLIMLSLVGRPGLLVPALLDVQCSTAVFRPAGLLSVGPGRRSSNAAGTEIRVVYRAAARRSPREPRRRLRNGAPRPPSGASQL